MKKTLIKKANKLTKYSKFGSISELLLKSKLSL